VNVELYSEQTTAKCHERLVCTDMWTFLVHSETRRLEKSEQDKTKNINPKTKPNNY